MSTVVGTSSLTIGILAALLALFLGPSVYQAASGNRGLRLALRWFLIVAISALIVFDVLPDCYRQAGWIIFPLALAGAVGPTLIERIYRSWAHQAHNLALRLGVLSLFLHGLTDGAALQLSGPDQIALPTAIVLHRFPVGMTIWWLIRNSFGRRVAIVALLVAAALTVLGAILAEPIAAFLTGTGSAAFQAFVAGSLLHVILHRPDAGEHRH